MALRTKSGDSELSPLRKIPLQSEPLRPIPSAPAHGDNSEGSFSDRSHALRFWSKTTLKSLLVPGGVLLLVVAVLVSSGWLTLAPPALSFLYYCALIGGMLLAWRFHSSRTFFALVVLFLAEQAVALSGSAIPSSPGWTALRAVSILVPLNFVLIALMQECG